MNADDVVVRFLWPQGRVGDPMMTSATDATPRSLTHVRCVRRLPGFGPAKQRKKMDSDHDSRSTTAYVWWRTFNPRMLAPFAELHVREREEEGERRGANEVVWRRGVPSSSIYRLGGGEGLLPSWSPPPPLGFG